ncbi:putative uncharacterized protein DDB_G0282133 [Condylostylus longicornis]|uniref:putative uncharacterized protein DDB_G0282133 n=1 Tax=Condylostylus longicornis TaxID=2530218 RepID=UPI00244DBAC9|nr:putative uncharacterized protein DDB_G0282133 [Condylostylus longicornis]
MHNSYGLKYSWGSLVIKIIIYFYLILYTHMINGAPSSTTSLAAGVKTTSDGKYKVNNLNVIDGSDTNFTNLTRQHDGDIFSANDISKCNLDTCVGLSSGTASLVVTENKKTDVSTATNSDDSNLDGCTCRCHSYSSTYREDLGICVDDIRECKLSPFVSGSSTEKIPFVFLPLRGQIIYPSREIIFAEIQTPICAVTGSQYLTSNGWADLRNPIDTDLPFRMFRDEGRTFLQWLGEPELRHKMQGRLVLIHLMCRDMTFSNNKSTLNNDPNANLIGNNIYTPCVAFRISGSPVKYIHNVSEVLFQSEASSNLSAAADGLSAREYIVIGVCSLLLGLIYVASVFLYLHVKKRKNLSSEPARSSLDDLDNDINYPKNDQVTFGVPFTRTGSSYSINSVNDHRNSQRSHSRSLNSPVSGLKEDIGVIKNNPLLKHFPSLSDHSGFTSDLSNSNSEFEDNQSSKNEKLKINQTSAIIHPTSCNKIEMERNAVQQESSPSPTQENECLPEANVSIIEEVGVEEKQLENMRALVNGTVRKKLYFNPAYFEPHLLLSPPPAAIEFLTKIREVIAIAKYKMASKRYQPSLGAIIEEVRTDGSEIYSKRSSQHREQNVNYVKIEETKKLQTEMPVEHQSLEVISISNKGVGDKTNSIQKWLETVPQPNENIDKSIKKIPNPTTSTTTQFNNCKIISDANFNSTTKQQKQESNRSLRKMSPPKVKPPPVPAISPATKSAIYASNIKMSPLMQKKETIEINQPNREGMTSQITYHQEKPITPVLKNRHYDGKSIYQYTDRAEIYNNPKFSHSDSPQLSQKSRSTRSRSSKKRMEVLDQYSNPQKLEPSHYELMKNIKQMPDMVYEALAKDYSMGMYSSSSRPNSQTFNIPTPDYDSTLDKKIKNIYNNSQNGNIVIPSVPTPDYSTLGKRSNGRLYHPPDSPIYRRKSPQYLIVDYETDSLERTTHQNRKCSNSSSPTSNNSSEISSHPSPSLSTALPLEEEVEIRHTVYDKVEGFRKDGDSHMKKKGSKNSAEYEDIRNSNVKKTLEPLIKYDTPFRGSMTIEVQHEPLSDFEPSTDSDQFEPDTLDRKPKKHSFCDVKSTDAWSEHLKKSKNFVNSQEEKISYSSLENMTSLPDFSNNNYSRTDSLKNYLILKSSSSFRSNIETANKRINTKYNEINSNLLESRPSFGSLREIYQSKAHRNPHQRPKLTNVDFSTEQGRLLTLEAKHTRRQRQIQDKDRSSKVLPPDVVPTTITDNNNGNNISNSGGSKEDNDSKLYHDIKKSRTATANSAIEEENLLNGDTNNIRKNFQGWNTDNFSGNHNDNIVIKNNNNKFNNITNKNKHDPDYFSHDDTEETISNHSESTEITGVSDTQGNSEFEDDLKSKDRIKESQQNSRKHKNKFRKNFIVNLPISNNSDETNSNNSNDNTTNDSAIRNQTESPINSTVINQNVVSLSEFPSIRSKNKHINLNGDRSYDRYLNRKKNKEHESENYQKSEIKISENITESSEANKYSKSLICPDQNSNIKQIYRVEIESPMNGMQIAMGLKDRSKKSKDLKNAWKRFVCLATSKLSSNNSAMKSDENSDLRVQEQKNKDLLVTEKEIILSRSIYDKSENNTRNEIQNEDEQINCKQIIKTNKLLTGRYNFCEPNYLNGQQKHELDSGYMSADSSEVYARRYYERFNFKAMTETEHITLVDTIEDNLSDITNKNKINNCNTNNNNINSSNNDNSNISNENQSNNEIIIISSLKGRHEENSFCSNSKENNAINVESNGHNKYTCLEDENVIVTASESDDDGGNTEDLSESGAESVETHSVFFKNIRKKS